MGFNFKKSQIYKAVRFSRLLVLGSLKFWRVLFLTIGFISLGFYAVNYLLVKIDPASANEVWRKLPNTGTLLGWAYILLPLGFFILFLNIFFSYYLKYPRVRANEQNLAEFLDFDSAKVIANAGIISRLLKESAISTNALLLSITSYPSASHIFVRLGINPSQLKEELEKAFNLSRSIRGFSLFGINAPSEELTNLITDAHNLRAKHNNERITMMDLIASLFDYNPIFKQMVIDINLDKNDLESLSVWYESNFELYRKKRMFWLLENLLRKPPIGVGWTYGYSWYLSHYATDLTRQFQQGQLEIKLIGRQKIIDQIEQVLARSGQNNILLVGESGVGKHTVIMGFAEMISEGKALPALNYKRVFELNVPLITSSSKNLTEIQNTLITLLNEAVKAGNVILVIEDFHNFIGALSGMGRLDISQLLLPYLESTNIQVIATTDPVSFHKHIESRAEIIKVFEKIEVEEPSLPETLQIIEELVPTIESRFGLLFTYGAIKNTVEASDKYITSAPFPEKAIDLLTEVVSRVKSQKKSIVLPQDIDEIITLKTNIPLGKITGGEKEKLINLEAGMRQVIIGQDEAVRAIAQTMQRLRTGLTKRNKPAGVFLFIGPTGVGKTLTAKILAKTYFGSSDKMIRFDMSEYQDPESLDRFLGSLKINEPGQFASKVRDEPFSVILLDEIEKAHKNILNIFLSVFDEGRMTDVFGRKVNFEQNIIIATSNASAELIRDMVNQGLDPSMQKEKIIDALVSGHYFSPEFLNRFDEIVIFHPLNQEQLLKITALLVGGLVERLREQGYSFKPTLEIIDYISRVGFDPQFGARPIQRVVQDKLETVIARKILEGTIRKGEEFALTLEEVAT